MNVVCLLGRLTATPELKTTQGGVSVTSFSVAVDRTYQPKGAEQRQADFINCVAWRNTAEFICRYFQKGQRIALQGSLQSRNYTDKDGRVAIEISIIDRPFETDRKKLRHIIEFISKRRFGEAEINVGDIKTTITFEEKYLYDVQFGYSQKSLNKKGFCGDSVSFISCGEGMRTALISDGMGTGSRAAIDSTLTSSVIEKLVSGGFSVDGAVKAVNSAMIMKSTDESISTVDAVSVNLYTATADFYKSGAAISFIRSANEVFVVKQESLPLGIIRNISPAHTRVNLAPGDIILLVSDGVTSEDCGWINDELLSWSTNNMEDLASHISSLASLRSDENTKDDITAVALKISKVK